MMRDYVKSINPITSMTIYIYIAVLTIFILFCKIFITPTMNYNSFIGHIVPLLLLTTCQDIKKQI